MLPLGILNASTKNVRMNPNSTIETNKILIHSPRKVRPLRPLLSSRNASMRCSGVIERAAPPSGDRSFTGSAEDSLIDIGGLLVRRLPPSADNRMDERTGQRKWAST